jgi:hypothetical protein
MPVMSARLRIITRSALHGVLAPNAPWRREVVARAESETSTVEPGTPSTPVDDQREDATADRARPRYRAWAELMRRAFEADRVCRLET